VSRPAAIRRRANPFGRIPAAVGAQEEHLPETAYDDRQQHELVAVPRWNGFVTRTVPPRRFAAAGAPPGHLRRGGLKENAGNGLSLVLHAHEERRSREGENRRRHRRGHDVLLCSERSMF